MTDEPAVACRGVRYAFGETVAVDGLDLEVRPGEVFGLLGPNGAGKTTTIRMITTLLPAPPGSISVLGHDVARRRTAVRRLIGYVPQQLSADGTLTGRENVTLFARLFDVPRRGRAGQVATALEAMDLTDAADRPATTYSGGMVRRLELAQALVSAPRLLVLDEPTVGLDPVARDTVWERITDIRDATGMTVLVTTHAMQEADEHCDRIGLMHRVQPALWLIVFGQVFTRIHAIPTGSTPYLDFLAPGILAQSALFIAIFYGIQIIWERDAGVLSKLLVTPTPRIALVASKAFAAGVRAVAQAVVVLVLALLLGVGVTANPLKWLGVVVALMLGWAFFCCLSITIAGLVLSRDRLMGIGQAITMPLFFASNALYPVELMPTWLQWINHVNPLSYEVDALRGLIVGTDARLALDFGVLVVAAGVMIAIASAVLPRLARG